MIIKRLKMSYRVYTYLLSAFCLSGCAIYGNLEKNISCQFNGNCQEIESEEDVFREKVKAAINDRCSNKRMLKFGTLEYMDCSENLKAYYNHLIAQNSSNDFLEQLKSEEKICANYGMKVGTKNFTKCLEKFESKYAKNIQQDNERDRAALIEMSEGLNSLSNSIPTQPTNGSPNNIHCSSYSIGGRTYTNCF